MPVLAVDVQTDRNIAAVLGLPHRHDLVGRRRLGVTEERCPEELQRPPGEGLEQALRGFLVGQPLRVPLHGDAKRMAG